MGSYLRGGILTCAQGRDIRDPSLRLAQPQPLVGKEEEGAVLDDWSAQHAAEIILPDCWLRQPTVVSEPVVGVQYVIAEILKQSAGKTVRPTSGDDLHLPAGCPPELRRVG